MKSLKEKYDLVVVGSSFASSFFLKRYLEKQGPKIKVLVLERGQFFPLAERLKVSRQKALGDVSFISDLGNQGITYENSNPSKPWIFDPNFGGSSNCWTGCTPRFMPNDFKLNSKYGVGYDWPITYDELETFYVQAEEVMSIAGPAETPYPMSQAYPLPAHQLSSVDKILHKAYGNEYISQPTARASRAVNGRGACCTSAICHLCPVSAKFTIENGLKYIYEDPRVEIKYKSRVFSLDLENDRAKAVLFENEGEEFKVQCDAVAMGANAIFNAHILLNAGDQSYWTGRGISEQVGTYGYFNLDGLDNLGGSSTITANGFMLQDTVDRKDRASCLIESHNDFFIRNEKGKWRQIAKFKFVFEDIPQESNRIVLSEDRWTPKVEYGTHSAYVDKARAALDGQVQKIFAKLPIESYSLDGNYQVSEAHILGSTRMSAKANDGVVDENLIHHKYRNVFVLGGGAFPAISASNPTLTLAALSLKSAEYAF